MTPYAEARAALVHDFERQYVSDLVAHTNGNVSKAARVAGMDRSYLMKLMKKHGIDAKAIRSTDPPSLPTEDGVRFPAPNLLRIPRLPEPRLG